MPVSLFVALSELMWLLIEVLFVTELSVERMIQYFLSTETLSDKNKYFCESCKSLQDAEKVLIYT